MESTDMKRLFPSRFLLTLEKDGLVVLFHQLRPEPVYFSKKSWQEITSCINLGIQPKHNIVLELVARKLFIVNSQTDQQMLEMVREQTIRWLNRPTILYLMMAQGCNLECSCCSIPALAKIYGERLLSFEDAIAGIALWQKHIKEQPQDNDLYFLIFYGGEPLLNRGILERLLPYVVREQKAERLPEKLELMLCTNGLLIDGELSGLLAYYKVTVAIGMDGWQERNDFIKPKHVIKRLINDGVRVVASITITPTNINRLAEYPDYFRELGISQFGFNLMKGKALIHELAGGSIEDYCRAAAQGVLQGLSSPIVNGRYYEYQLEKKLIALRKGLPFSVDCTCYGNQLVIQADGQVSNCPFLRFDQGQVRELPGTFRIGWTEAVKTWRRRLPILNDSVLVEYSDSVLDGGGCAWSSLELYGDVVARDTVNTIFTKEVMYGLIWTLLPKKQADALRRGETAYWGYRRVRF